MSKQIVLNYISGFKDDLKAILDKYYGDKLIINAYDYYQNITYVKLEKALNSSSIKWDNFFDMLEKEIRDNKNDFTSSLDEFVTMSIIYYSIITQNVSTQYFNSVIEERKNEVNYTISYYYNYLINLANSTNNYIINRIISNQNQFNYIVEHKKFIINDFFLNLMNNITLLKEESLSMEKQISTLGVATTNFFKSNNILNDHITYLKNSLMEKMNKINSLRNNIPRDQYSLSAKIYKENIESAEKIKNLYSPINEGTFVILNSEKIKFEEIIINNNWVFNFDELSNELDAKLYNLNKEIEDEFLILRNNYKEKLEQSLLNEKFFTKDGIIEKIVEIYNEGLIKIDSNKKNNIMEKINEMVNYIIQYLNNEAINLKKNPVSFDDNLIPINNTLEKFKEEILKKINETIMILPNEFNINMEEKFYQNYILQCLNILVRDLKVDTNQEDYNLLNSAYNYGNIINNILNEIKNEYNIITIKQLSYQYNKKIKEIYEIIALDEIKAILDNKIDSKFKNDLLPVLERNLVKNAGYKEYNIDNEKQKEINDIIIEKMKDIELILNSTKGNNYQIEIKNWEPASEFDFTSINFQKIIHINIKDNFKSFYEKKLEYEQDNISNLLDEIIKNNFNNLLSYLIPSFGKSFFDRVLNYNENFKIMTLYDNLRYSVSSTMAFFQAICKTKTISAFPMDLKTRLYNLNNLAKIVEEKNTYILNKISGNLDQFINEVQQFIVNEYSTRYNNEFSVEQKYKEAILSMIQSKLYNTDTFIKKICRNALEKYLKEPFIESYKNVMNLKSYEMIRFANEQKEDIRQNIFNKLTINSEDILNQINEKLNKTEESINAYENHFKTFKINNEIIQFLNDYGKNSVQPLYLSIINLINNAKTNNKISILNDLDLESEKYVKKFNITEFIDLSEKTVSYFKNYIENITEEINIYNPDDYKENLEKEKFKYEMQNIRRLEGNETEEDIQKRFNDKIADNKLDDTFKNILEASQSLKDSIDNLGEFEDYDDKLKLYSKNLDEEYNRSESIIINKKEKGIFDEEIYNNFSQKLIELRNMTEDYYYQINRYYNNLQGYLKESISRIYNSLNKCANITYITFSEEYNKIKEEIIPNPIKNNYSNFENKNNLLSHSFNSANNGLIKYDFNINSIKNAFFSIDLELLNKEQYNPTLIAKIINLSGPKNMKIKIISGTSNCGGEKEKNIDAVFGDVNYTMVIYFNTESTKINVTTISNIEDYRYTIKEFVISEEYEEEEEEMEINGIKMDFNILNTDGICVRSPNPEGDDVISMKFENNNIPSTHFIENLID